MSLVLLLLLCSSCGLLQRAREYNAEYDAEHTLRQIERSLEAEPPSGEAIRTLYMIDEEGKYRAELLQLLPQLKQRDDRVRVAFYSGDPMLLQETIGVQPKTALDSLCLANHALRAGNWREAMRLSPDDPATHAISLLMMGDTLQAVSELWMILQAEERLHPRYVRLQAGRKLLEVTAEIDASLFATVAKVAIDLWERFVMRALAGDTSPTNDRERAFVLCLKSQSDSTLLRDAARAYLATSAKSFERKRVLLWLREALLSAGYYPEAEEVQLALPDDEQKSLPYLLLAEYHDEIDLLRRYERMEGEREEAPLLFSDYPKGSFRQLWGNVPNVDNWAMRYYAQPIGAVEPPLRRPSHEEYTATREELDRIFGVVR